MEINEAAIRNYIIKYGNDNKLAYELDLSLTTLKYIVQGRRKPGIKVLMALVNHGVPMDKLLINNGRAGHDTP